ncbi:winged helix-turn-helix transcriptional regulator [Brevundimonas aurifodinae]|uniref:winged helix-turn-helix transcriptional regulator n=1 Tax=Brevundimonas aurifodinae TaxID=1508312 RepID=UPI003D80F908
MRKPNTSQARNEARLEDACPFAFTLRTLGSRWRPAILWKMALGDRTYGALKRSLPGISDKMLAQDLRVLVKSGLVSRTQASRDLARSSRYTLTPSGEALLPLLREMQHWGSGALERRREADLPGEASRTARTSDDRAAA